MAINATIIVFSSVITFVCSVEVPRHHVGILRRQLATTTVVTRHQLLPGSAVRRRSHPNKPRATAPEGARSLYNRRNLACFRPKPDRQLDSRPPTTPWRGQELASSIDLYVRLLPSSRPDDSPCGCSLTVVPVQLSAAGHGGAFFWKSFLHHLFSNCLSFS